MWHLDNEEEFMVRFISCEMRKNSLVLAGSEGASIEALSVRKVSGGLMQIAFRFPVLSQKCTRVNFYPSMHFLSCLCQNLSWPWYENYEPEPYHSGISTNVKNMVHWRVTKVPKNFRGAPCTMPKSAGRWQWREPVAKRKPCELLISTFKCDWDTEKGKNSHVQSNFGSMISKY